MARQITHSPIAARCVAGAVPASPKRSVKRLPASRSVISKPGQCAGTRGVSASWSPRTSRPSRVSIAARCSQAAEPVYQLQPPRPT